MTLSARLIGYSEDFRGFTQSFQGSDGIIPSNTPGVPPSKSLFFRVYDHLSISSDDT
jgi:hypothetical protein